MVIVDKASGKKVKEIDGVGGDMTVAPDGQIYFSDDQNRVRLVQTNFAGIPPGGVEAVKRQHEERLRQLIEAAGNLTVDTAQARTPRKFTEIDVNKALEAQLQKLFGERINKAKTPNELALVSSDIERLKQDSRFIDYPQSFNKMEADIGGRISAIQVEGLAQAISRVETLGKDIKTVDQAANLDAKVTELELERGKANIIDPEKRREIDERIQALKQKRDTVVEHYQAQITSILPGELTRVQALIDRAGSLDELSDLSGHEAILKFDQLTFFIKDPKAAAEWQQKLSGVINSKREQIRQSAVLAEEAKRTKLVGEVDIIRQGVSEFETRIIETVASNADLERLRRSPQLIQLRAKILSLPSELRQEEETKLEALLAKATTNLRIAKSAGVLQKAGEVDFAGEKFPVFAQSKAAWAPKIVPLSPGSQFGHLVYADTSGREFVPDRLGSIPLSLTDPTTEQVISLTTPEARAFFAAQERTVPTWNEKWVYTQYMREMHGRIAKRAKLQLEMQDGILVVESEAGAGKNVLWDMFGHFTNEEIVTIPCNFSMERQDLIYEYWFDPKTGTVKIPSQLINGIQRPGTMIDFTEINTLPPEVLKLLNSLFDYRRSVFVTEGNRKQQIRAHPSVLFVGDMNPTRYIGTKKLSPEVKDRADILLYGYPPLQETGSQNQVRYRSDEAEMAAKMMEPLKALNQTEFVSLWNLVVNKEQGKGGEQFKTAEREDAVKRLLIVVKVANKIREAFDAYQSGRSLEQVDFPFSLRATTRVAAIMNHTVDPKAAIKEVIGPKIEDIKERQRIFDIIDQTG